MLRRLTILSRSGLPNTRGFSATCPDALVLSTTELSPRSQVEFFQDQQSGGLLSLRWRSPLKNVMVVKKQGEVTVDEAVVRFIQHVNSSFADVRFIAEPKVAQELSEKLDGPIYSPSAALPLEQCLREKVDLVTTFGGDGTVLNASSLLSTTSKAPPLLTFSMGTLGFLGDWRFADFKRAFREVYMSGSRDAYDLTSTGSNANNSWKGTNGQSLGALRPARVLRRRRLNVKIRSEGKDLAAGRSASSWAEGKVQKAMNEVIIHRGADPQLAIIEIFVGGKFLTEAVGDGMILSTPTGSTAYSLSCGGSILHPLIPAVMLTPICPRSLSFRPVVLPGDTSVTLKLSKKNRGRKVEVSIDGQRWGQRVSCGLEVEITNEPLLGQEYDWMGGVPCVVKTDNRADGVGNDGWVGGLNGLLKFNHPFGDEG